MIVDIHTHILPGMDDGSRNVAESTAMLREMAMQGIDCVAATPHFDPAWDNPESFFLHRAMAEANLLSLWEPKFPRMLLGAEVRYFEGISHADGMENFCIEDTQLLLLEMPHSSWTGRMAAEVISLHKRQGITVLLAHVERYFWLQKRRIWEGLVEAGVLMQSNADFFIRHRTRRQAVHMLKDGKIHLLGSDCHGIAERTPCLGTALEIIGDDGVRILEENRKRYLPTLEVSYMVERREVPHEG